MIVPPDGMIALHRVCERKGRWLKNHQGASAYLQLTLQGGACLREHKNFMVGGCDPPAQF
ncbi:hypothetical protein HK24_04320 [Gluconobacter sp. DsW_058]|nr:hypothetical protein HK24_04320 [Gluconobacter sp. DsW_058]